MYLKLTMLFLLIGFVAGLPYLFEKYGQVGKGRQEIDGRVDLAVSIANPESAGRGSIDEVRQSFHADEVHAGCHSSHKITAA